jgi:quercetin dioxygenase-like cupin family protein
MTPSDQSLPIPESQHVTTLHQTSYAVVQRVDLPAGAALPEHEGGPRVVYSRRPYTMRFEAEGQSSERHFEAGDVHFHSAGPHAIQNTGDQPAAFLVFVRTDAPLPAARADERLAAAAASLPADATHEVVLENDQVLVHRVALEPGASISPHDGPPPRIVYALTDYTLTVGDPEDDAREEQSFAKGDLDDYGPGRQRVENTGDTRAEYLVVAFKQ